LAKLRLREAEHLYNSGMYDGCVYLSGYVVEFALKAAFARSSIYKSIRTKARAAESSRHMILKFFYSWPGFRTKFR